MVCRDFILPEPASYVFFYAVFNLRKLLYIILESRRNQILPLKPENHAPERFSEWAGVEAERAHCFCV